MTEVEIQLIEGTIWRINTVLDDEPDGITLSEMCNRINRTPEQLAAALSVLHGKTYSCDDWQGGDDV